MSYNKTTREYSIFLQKVLCTLLKNQIIFLQIKLFVKKIFSKAENFSTSKKNF